MRNQSIDQNHARALEGGMMEEVQDVRRGRVRANKSQDEGDEPITLTRRKSRTPSKKREAQMKFQYMTSDGSQIVENELHTDDDNLRVKMQQSNSGLTYLKSQLNYDGSFYYIDDEEKKPQKEMGREGAKKRKKQNPEQSNPFVF